jgi:hypothetical protein
MPNLFSIFKTSLTGFAFCCATILVPRAGASINDVTVDSPPVVKNAGPATVARLRSVQAHLTSAGRACVARAKAKGIEGDYDARFIKTFQSASIVTFALREAAHCDREESRESAFALNVASGRNFNLNEVYQVAEEDSGVFTLKPEVAALLQHDYYRDMPKFAPACFKGAEHILETTAVSLGIDKDHSLAISFAVPAAKTTCFGTMYLSQKELTPYRNDALALKYGLPH